MIRLDSVDKYDKRTTVERRQVIKKIAMFFLSMCVQIVNIVCVLFLNDQV
jgi:hypothetical protein